MKYLMDDDAGQGFLDDDELFVDDILGEDDLDNDEEFDDEDDE